MATNLVAANGAKLIATSDLHRAIGPMRTSVLTVLGLMKAFCEFRSLRGLRRLRCEHDERLVITRRS